MRTVLILAMCLTMVGFSVLPAPPVQAAPKAPVQVPEEYPPIHAVLMIHGWAIPAEGCSRHGINIVWEGDLEECDDDPEGIYPCASYTGSGPFATLRFDDWVCKQEGRDDVRFTHQYNSEATGSADLVLVDQMDGGSFDRSIRFVFHGFDLGYESCSDGTGPGSLSIDLSWTADFLTPPLSFTEEDIERGFVRTHRTTHGIMDVNEEEEWNPEIQASSWGDDYEFEATLTLSYKQDTKKPKVEIAGCAHLLPGGSEQLTATGTPSGGRYKWSAEPASVLDVSGSESSASVKAGQTGRATVRVEYEARNGKKAEATLPGSVVTLTSVNGGVPIPTIYLHDAYDNSTATIEAATAQDPPDGDLLRFEVADPSIATVTNQGSSIVIQGVNAGMTSAQAKTKCGEKTGPVITITVAGCDPESVAKLRERYKEVRMQFEESAHRVNKAITSREFDEASDKIDDDVIDAAVEAADLAAGGMAKAGAATKAVRAAAEIVETGATGWNVYRDEAHVTLIKVGVSVFVPGGAGLVSAYDKLNTVGRLLKHTAILIDADERVAREQPIQEGYSKELEQIDERIEKCKKEGPGGPKPGEPAAPKPPPTPPVRKPGGEKPGIDKPAPGEPTTPPQSGEPEPGGGETPPTEPPGGKPPVVEPPEPQPKPSGGGTAGLPIDCGCKSASTAAWRDEQSGLAAIAASLSLLQGCAESYAGELARFQADSASSAQAARAVESALATPGERGFKMFEAALPGLTAAVNSFDRLVKAAEGFRSTLEGCDKKVPEAVELVKKAGTALGTTPPDIKAR